MRLILTALDVEKRHLFPDGEPSDFDMASTGVGKVNAAIATTSLLNMYSTHCGLVVVAGVCGAVRPGWEIGQVCIGSSVIQHDMNAEPLIERPNTPYQDNPKLEPPDQAHRFVDGVDVRLGVIGTGDQFITTPIERDRAMMLGCDVVDMESYAVAYTCKKFEVPCIVVRGVTDKAGEDGEHFSQNIELAMRNVSVVVKSILDEWNADTAAVATAASYDHGEH